jgi:predicted GNAT family acetyltransferase
VDFPHFNYAIPDECVPDGERPDYEAGLDALHATFTARARLPRLEFVEACAPALGKVLEAGGYRLEARQTLMVCAKGELVMPIPPSQTVIEELDGNAPLSTIADYWRVQAIGFGVEEALAAPSEEVAALQATLATSRAFWARVAGRPAAVAMTTQSLDGITELVAVTTLPAYRGRGLGRALSAAIVQAAFDAGVSLVCLTTAGEAAERVYSAIGFVPIDVVLAYSLGEE